MQARNWLAASKAAPRACHRQRPVLVGGGVAVGASVDVVGAAHGGARPVPGHLGEACRGKRQGCTNTSERACCKCTSGSSKQQTRWSLAVLQSPAASLPPLTRRLALDALMREQAGAKLGVAAGAGEARGAQPARQAAQRARGVPCRAAARRPGQQAFSSWGGGNAVWSEPPASALPSPQVMPPTSAAAHPAQTPCGPSQSAALGRPSPVWAGRQSPPSPPGTRAACPAGPTKGGAGPQRWAGRRGRQGVQQVGAAGRVCSRPRPSGCARQARRWCKRETPLGTPPARAALTGGCSSSCCRLDMSPRGPRLLSKWLS